MSEQSGWIELAGQRVRLSDVRAHPYRYGRLLAQARATRSAVCLCRPTRLRLVTRCGLGGRHHVACWPHEGPDHDPGCAFFHLQPDLSGRAGYSSCAIAESAAGTSIRLHAPALTRGTRGGDAGLSHPTHAGAQRRSVGLLGMLHYLWESSGLNGWAGPARRPQRTWAAVRAALREQLAICTINGQPAPDVIYVVPPYHPSTSAHALEQFDAFLARLTADAPQGRRGLLLAEVKAINPAAHGVRYQLAQQSRSRQLFMSATLDTGLRAAFPSALAAATQREGGRCIGLFSLQRSHGGYAVAVDAALMLTTASFIPADSSYEITMTDALQAAGRAFVKPLTYDAGHDAVFPDFVLTDEPRSYVEVWGLPGRRDYERRKEANRAFYQRHASALLDWTVTEPIPNLTLTPPVPGREVSDHPNLGCDGGVAGALRWVGRQQHLFESGAPSGPLTHGAGTEIGGQRAPGGHHRHPSDRLGRRRRHPVQQQSDGTASAGSGRDLADRRRLDLYGAQDQGRYRRGDHLPGRNNRRRCAHRVVGGYRRRSHRLDGRAGPC